MFTTSPQRLQEPIVIAAKQHNFFPKVFVWRGQRHDVQSVEACRTEVQRGWRGPAERHCFRVRTDAGIFELVQDLTRDVWLLDTLWPKAVS